MAIAVGCAGLALHLAPAVLAPPASCPGLLERAAITGAKLGRSVPVGLWLIPANRVLLVLVLAIVAGLAYAATGMWAIAAAAGLAFAARPGFALTMSAFDPLAVGVAGVTLFALWSRSRDHASLFLLLLLNAAIVPRSALPMAVMAGWVAVLAARGNSPRRWVAGALSSLAVFAAVAILISTMPGLPPWTSPLERASCLVPGPAAGWAARCGGALSTLLASAGPFVCSLAALGAFSLRGRLRDARAWPMLAYIATSAVLGAWPDAHPDRTLAPALVAMWLLAAVGLAEVARACRESVGGRIAAAALIVLLPLLNITERDDRIDGPERAEVSASTFGHDRMSLEGVRRALQVLPDRSVIISEDAVTDMLLRGLDGEWQRFGKSVQLVSSRVDDSAVAAAVRNPSAHVFALPRAQARLPYLGFRLVDTSLPGISGLSEVEPGGDCLAVGPQWAPIPGISRSTTLALVARETRNDGAVALYTGGDHPLDPRPVDWPAWIPPGVIASTYSRGDQDQVQLTQDVLNDGLAQSDPVLRQPYVVRIELWKVPGAPELLAVDLGAAAPSLGVARASSSITVQLCPAFPHTVRAIALPR